MDEQTAYLAGFFDGEGSIQITKTGNSHSLQVSISQLDPRPLIMCMEKWGGSIRRQPDKRGFRTLVIWIVAARKALRALEDMRPLLIVKAAQADLAIEFQSLRDSWVDKGAELARRDDLRARIKQLKQEIYDEIELPLGIRGPRQSSPRRLEQKARPSKPKPPKKHRVKVAVPVRSTGYDRKKKPSREALVEAYADHGATEAARVFGVSRQTLYNWLDSYDIPRAGRTPESEVRRVQALRQAWKA